MIRQTRNKKDRLALAASRSLNFFVQKSIQCRKIKPKGTLHLLHSKCTCKAFCLVLRASSVLLPERFHALRVCTFGPRFSGLLQKFDPLTVSIPYREHLRVLLLRRAVCSRFPANFLSFLIAKLRLLPSFAFVKPLLKIRRFIFVIFHLFSPKKKKDFFAKSYRQTDF